jgi:hypothetical protein
MVGVFVKEKMGLKKTMREKEESSSASLSFFPSLLLHVRAKEREQSVV